MIRHRQLRSKDGTVVAEGGDLAREDLELNKALEDIGNLTEDQREVMNKASTFTDGRAEEIERLRAESYDLCVQIGTLAAQVQGLRAEVTMLRERLTRWAKVITKMYKQVTQEILF